MWKDIDTFTGIRAKISPIIRTSHFMMAIMGWVSECKEKNCISGLHNSALRPCEMLHLIWIPQQIQNCISSFGGAQRDSSREESSIALALSMELHTTLNLYIAIVFIKVLGSCSSTDVAGYRDVRNGLKVLSLLLVQNLFIHNIGDLVVVGVW